MPSGAGSDDEVGEGTASARGGGSRQLGHVRRLSSCLGSLLLCGELRELRERAKPAEELSDERSRSGLARTGPAAILTS